jgi:hypothetical protein
MGASTLTFVAAVRHFYEEFFNKKNPVIICDLIVIFLICVVREL